MESHTPSARTIAMIGYIYIYIYIICNITAAGAVYRELIYNFRFVFDLSGSGTNPIGFVIEFYPICPIRFVRSSFFRFLMEIPVF